MKNINGKTMIFYTFQQKKDLEYNMIAYKNLQQNILIKDVIQQLPLDLKQGRYHFRFKSEFTEGNQKIIGWIDINNLMAKVPHVNGSIYVKILKLKSNNHNKLFNLQKLAKVGLGIKNNDNLRNSNNTNSSTSVKNIISPINNIKNKEPQASKKQSPSVQLNQIPVQISNLSNTKRPQSKKQIDLIEHPFQQNKKPNISTLNTDFIDMGQIKKPFVNRQTNQQKLEFIQKVFQQQQLAKANQMIARDQLQQKIQKWGYSGAKTINNLTTLLSTLHEIWPQWPAISLTDLLRPQDLAKYVKKAQIKTHPDKNRNQSFKQKYLAKRVFQLINQAKKSV